MMFGLSSALRPRLLLWLVLALACLAAAGAWDGAQARADERNAFRVADLVRLRRISDLRLSPDGRYATFTSTQPDMGANRNRTSIWLLDLSAAKVLARPLTAGNGNDWNARWAPDGRGVYFLSTRSGDSQIWRLTLPETEPVQVSHLPVDVDTLKVSPTGKRLLASMDVFPDCADLECSARRSQSLGRQVGSGRVYDRLFVRHWDQWSDGRESHLFSLAISPAGGIDGTPVDLTRSLDADVPSKPFGGDEEFNFSPDGTRVAFTTRIKGKTEPWSTNFEIFEVAADGHDQPHDLTADNPAWDTQPAYSPDGRWLAWKAMARPKDEADRFHLVLEDLRTGRVHAFAPNWDRSVDSFVFASDGRHLLVTADNLGQHPLWSFDLRGGAPKLLQAKGHVSEFAQSGASLVYGLATLDAPVDLYRISTRGGLPQRLTHFNSALLDSRRLGTFEQFSFAGWNGERVYGYLVRPAAFQADRKYPLAFIVHGGPELSYANEWSYRWNPQIYAGAGYAVILIDFHGSTGYGQAFTDSILRDWGGKPLEDLRLGLAAALARFPWIDGARRCALGASYSGYMMNWIEGNWPDGFRCLVNQSGQLDNRSEYYQADELWLDEFEQGAPQYEDPAAFERQNPVRLVSRWHTPMLVGHGELDFDVPVAQGIATFTALQRRGIESRLIVFPDEGHFILKPQNVLQWNHEILAWLGRWLEPTRTAPSAKSGPGR